jgi:2,4-diketo-3-deoxy-L-fuconate hydrolase
MRLANVGGRAVIVIDGRVADVESLSRGSLGSDPMDLVDLANHESLRTLADGLTLADLVELDESSLGPPVPRPGKVIAMALNYRSHAEEADKALPDQPHVMVKFSTCVCGPYDDVHMHDLEMVDYEAELVVAIGKMGKQIAEQDAWSHVSGLMVGNDVSDRNEQFRPPIKQFSMAKSYDEFGPTGPYLVTPDDVPDRDDLGLELKVDGELRQRARTSDFIFSIPVLMAWLSRYVTLEVGDLIFTGTPGGVGDSMNPPVYLEDGQVVETTIEGIGSLRNRFVAGGP